MLLGIDFWVDFVGFWVPKWSQVGTKMGSTSIFDTFQWILGGKLGGKMDQKSIQKGIGKRMEKITMQERRILLQKSMDRAESAWVRLGPLVVAGTRRPLRRIP